VISVSKYEAKGHSLGVGIDGHARGGYIQQDDAAFYGITSISCCRFGSRRIGARTGILFNDEMNDFLSPKPMTVANVVEPGKRPQSSMCPAIILDAHGDIYLVIGASGATLITSSTAYVSFHR